MKLRSYLNEKGRGSLSELAKKINVNLPDLSSWANGHRPVPIKYCLKIEKATCHQVTRKDLRPNDYKDYWTDLD